LGTNAGSQPIPFQRWRAFKEAFAPELVERAVAEMDRPVRHIVDPFGGSGTTGLAAQFLGVHPTLIEVNPYLADLIEAKLARYDIDEVRDSYVRLIDLVYRTRSVDPPYFSGAPKTFVEPGIDGRYLFTKENARSIAIYMRAIRKLPNPNIRRLFRAILGSCVVAVSNVVVSGKGRRYRRGWESRQSDPSRLDHLFREAAGAAIYDLHRYAARRCRDYSILRGDARSLLPSIGNIDLAVFSPPYPNSFDYTDVYNVELWTLGYLRSSQENLDLRNATLRSHVQIARDISATEYPSKRLKHTIAKLQKVRDNLWNRRIPEMVSAYISDMGGVMASLRKNLSKRGRVYMVVGDSRYAGIQIPVASILAEIAPHVGLSARSIEPFRSMRASPQQGGQYELAESLVILERT
jgi:hypothetical protein